MGAQLLRREDEAGLVGVDDGLHAVAQVQLGQHVGHVGLHRRLAQHERAGDLAVRQSPAQQHEHLALAGGQQGQLVGLGPLGRHRSRPRRSPGHLADDAAGHLRREQRVPATGGTYGVEQLLGTGVLQQEAARPGLRGRRRGSRRGRRS